MSRRLGAAMLVRYHSIEGAIRAAGAALACSEDDLSAPRRRQPGWRFSSVVILAATAVFIYMFA